MSFKILLFFLNYKDSNGLFKLESFSKKLRISQEFRVNLKKSALNKWVIAS